MKKYVGGILLILCSFSLTIAMDEKQKRQVTVNTFDEIVSKFGVYAKSDLVIRAERMYTTIERSIDGQDASCVKYRNSLIYSDETRHETEIVQASAIRKNGGDSEKNPDLLPGTTKGPDTPEFKESLRGRMLAYIWEQQRANKSYILPCGVLKPGGDFRAVTVSMRSRNLDEFYMHFQDNKGAKPYTDLQYWGLYHVSGTKFPQYNARYVQREDGKFAHQHFLYTADNAVNNPSSAADSVKVPESEGVTISGKCVAVGVVVAAIAGLLKVCSWW